MIQEAHDGIRQARMCMGEYSKNNPSRITSIVQTKLEEAQMWLDKIEKIKLSETEQEALEAGDI